MAVGKSIGHLRSRFITLNYLDQPVGQSYLALKSLVEDKTVPYHNHECRQCFRCC